MSALNNQVMQEAADALLDVGVSVPLAHIKLPWTKKPLRIAVTMRRPTFGGHIRIAKLFLALGFTYEEIEAFTPEEQTAFIATRGHILSQMVALCILRGYWSGLIMAKPLAWVLRWCVRDTYLIAALNQYIRLMGTQSFKTIIRYTGLTNPMLSQTQGS